MTTIVQGTHGLRDLVGRHLGHNDGCDKPACVAGNLFRYYD